MTFGSWAYHGNEIDLGFYSDMEMLDISDLERESTEWEITYKSESRRIQYYDCCDDPYVILTFSLEMKRKLVFSSFILTLPCIFLACMTLVVFWLPPERPDRTSLGTYSKTLEDILVSRSHSQTVSTRRKQKKCRPALTLIKWMSWIVWHFWRQIHVKITLIWLTNAGCQFVHLKLLLYMGLTLCVQSELFMGKHKLST